MLSTQVLEELKEPADGGWADKEIQTFGRRVERFTKAGMNAMAAENLAQRMLYRDRPESGDDRRICLECKGFKKGVCAFAESMGLRRGLEPVWSVLQRCDGFAMKGAA